MNHPEPAKQQRLLSGLALTLLEIGPIGFGDGMAIIALGPALTGMGAMHPTEYCVQAVIGPNASVAWRITHHKFEQKRYPGADGKSKMPSYNDTMTIQQLIDIVAYMKHLTTGDDRTHAHQN